MISLFAAVLISLPWLSDDSETAPVPETKRTFTVGPIAKAVRQFVRRGDDALTGRQDSLVERQELSRQLAEKFSAEPAETWENANNAAELMRFVLFGGDVATLKRLVEQGTFPKEFEQTAKGIVAFSERRLDSAREYLVASPPDHLPGHIEEALALVKGTLLATAEADKAIAEFRKVELKAPGTALEEAAIRQHVMTLIRQGRIKNAIEKIRVYVRRYPQSIYWKQFHTVAASGVAKSTGFDPADLAAPDKVGLSQGGVYRLYELSVAVGKTLVLDGSFETARSVLEPCVSGLDRSTNLWRRADLYYNLAGAIGADPGSALAALRAVDVEKLPEDEKSLVEAGILIAAGVKAGYREGAVPGTRSKSNKPPALEAIDRIQPLPGELNARVKESMELAQKKLAEAFP